MKTSALEYCVLVIAAITPLIIGVVYKILPRIPKVILPSLAPVVGILLGWLINWLGRQNISWLDMAQAGALAVFVREVFTNAVTKQLAQPDPEQPPDAQP